MLDVVRQKREGAARGTTPHIVALARLAPFIPVAAYLAVAPLEGAFHLDLALALGAAALLAVAAVHLSLKRYLQPIEASVRLLEARLKIDPPPANGKSLADPARLAKAAEEFGFQKAAEIS